MPGQHYGHGDSDFRPRARKRGCVTTFVLLLMIVALVIGIGIYAGNLAKTPIVVTADPATSTPIPAAPTETPKPLPTTGPTAVPTAAPAAVAYALSATGNFPTVQFVGKMENFHITAKNIGPTIPQLVLTTDGRKDHWVLSNALSSCGQAVIEDLGGQDLIRLGSLAAGDTCNISLWLTPKSADNANLAVNFYPSNPGEEPDFSQQLQRLGGSIAINP